jgi:hypothetical protein
MTHNLLACSAVPPPQPGRATCVPENPAALCCACVACAGAALTAGPSSVALRYVVVLMSAFRLLSFALLVLALCRYVGEETIDFRGFKEAMASLNILLSDRKMKRVFNSIDKDGSRMIDFDEFAAFLSDPATTSSVNDWQQKVAEQRWKQKAAFEAAATIVRTPNGLYTLLRNLVSQLGGWVLGE